MTQYNANLRLFSGITSLWSVALRGGLILSRYPRSNHLFAVKDIYHRTADEENRQTDSQSDQHASNNADGLTTGLGCGHTGLRGLRTGLRRLGFRLRGLGCGLSGLGFRLSRLRGGNFALGQQLDLTGRRGLPGTGTVPRQLNLG